MSPNLSLSNSPDSAGTYAVLLGDFGPRSSAVEDFQHLNSGERGAAMLFAPCGVSRTISIVDVVGLGAERKMVEIDAWGVVAEMPNNLSIGDASVGAYPHKPMDLPRVSAYAKSAVPKDFPFAGPKYAARRVQGAEKCNALVDCAARRPRISNSGEFVRIEVVKVHAPLTTPN